MMSALRVSVALAAAALVLLVCGVGSASAAVPAAGWTMESFASPTNFSSGGEGAYQVTVTNAGSKATDTSPVTLTDTLPEHVTVQSIEFFWSGAARLEHISSWLTGAANLNLVLPSKLGLPEPCNASSVPPVQVQCTLSELLSRLAGGVEPDDTLRIVVHVAVNAGASGVLVNKAGVSGGGTPVASVEGQNVVSSAPVSFGASSFDFSIDGADGQRDSQAGDHPYEMRVTIGLNNDVRAIGPEADGLVTSVQDVKDVVVDLPVGFVGSTLAAPECTLAQLTTEARCPADTIVGHIRTEPEGTTAIDSPIYNLVPERGYPAEFGYYDVLKASHVFYAQVVPTASGYVLQTTNPDTPAIDLTHIEVVFYGDPAGKQEEFAEREGKVPSVLAQVPFFTDPTDCAGGPLVATMYLDSWQNPGSYNPDGTPDFGDGKWVSASSVSPPVTGCDLLQFPAQVSAQPTTREADTPSGLNFELKVPQSETMGAPATPTLKKIVTALPAGLTVDPSAGDGLAACSEAQIGWLGGSHLNFSPDPPSCPEASKIGSLELETPLIAHKLEGEMFLANQYENPFGATLAAYVVVNDPITGVLVKIAGEFVADPHTGQLTAVFDENPNIPFSDLKLHFFGGPRAELATPESCGTFTTNTELTPWSFPDSGPAASPFDSFPIDEACPAGFAPSFAALSSNVQAGAYTPFVASFSRSDADQELSGLSLTLPPGLLAKVAGIPECSEAQIQQAEASTGGCPEASQVGTVLASVGPGPNPLQVSGNAYLTGPYNDGPYGLAVVVPAVAGPYDFGTVVVRQSLRIDPHTAQVTDVSNPFPKIIDGIPLRLRRIDVTLNRPQFTFNPTSCEKQQFTGTLTGSPLGAPTMLTRTVGYATEAGASSPFTSPFQVTGCAALAFKPSFTVATAGHASKANGAGLLFKIAYPKAAMGAQTWFNEAKFDIPRQLPARLGTLQQACLAATFETKRSACPAASMIGHAVVHTEVLPEPLQGPVYFVSYGNAKFPDAVMVLHGSNVTIELHGNTLINNKTGITSATFHALPDVPFESIEVNIPQGPFSEFGANLPAKARYSFCGRKLTMPTFFKAANGLQITQNTPLQITGCLKPKHTNTKTTKQTHHTTHHTKT